MNDDEAAEWMEHQSFCIYCQMVFETPRGLRMHIEDKHPGTYAFANVNLGYAR